MAATKLTHETNVYRHMAMTNDGFISGRYRYTFGPVADEGDCELHRVVLTSEPVEILGDLDDPSTHCRVLIGNDYHTVDAYELSHTLNGARELVYPGKQGRVAVRAIRTKES